jgi:short-subunit dehydrogenase
MTTTLIDPQNQLAPAPHAAASVGKAVTGGWVVVVGASSAIGRAVAKRFAMAGHDIILAGRDVNDLDRSAADLRVRYGHRAETAPFDALAFDTHEAFWRSCQDKAPEGIAGIVVVHGQLPTQAEAQSNLQIAREAIDVNFVSVVSLLTYVANDLEARKHGFICVFSSVAGDRGRQSNYVYGSAKAALSTFLGGLRVRLFKSGVHVTTIKPGFVDTAMTWGLPGLFLVASPQRVAEDTFKAVTHGRSQIYTPFFWRYIMLIIRSVPEVIFKRMKM